MVVSDTIMDKEAVVKCYHCGGSFLPSENATSIKSISADGRLCRRCHIKVLGFKVPVPKEKLHWTCYTCHSTFQFDVPQFCSDKPESCFGHLSEMERSNSICEYCHKKKYLSSTALAKKEETHLIIRYGAWIWDRLGFEFLGNQRERLSTAIANKTTALSKWRQNKKNKLIEAGRFGLLDSISFVVFNGFIYALKVLRIAIFVPLTFALLAFYGTTQLIIGTIVITLIFMATKLAIWYFGWYLLLLPFVLIALCMLRVISTKVPELPEGESCGQPYR